MNKSKEFVIPIDPLVGGLGGYMNHEAGMLRHVSDLLTPDFFASNNGIPYSKVAGKDIAEWGKLLGNLAADDAHMAQAQLGGRIFEKLVAEGHASGVSGGQMAGLANQKGWDVITQDGTKIQCKFTIKSGGEISGHNLKQILNGNYNPGPPNYIGGISVPEESYEWLKLNQSNFFTEESPGILVGKDGTKIFNSRLTIENVDRITRETMERAKDGAFSITKEVTINSLKAGAIAAALALLVSGSINFYRYRNGTMRGDDAVDSTVGNSLKAGITATGTSFIVGGTLAVLGIPAVGTGLVIAIPFGILAGSSIGLIVNKSLDSVYQNIMGGKQIQIARAHIEWVHEVCARIDQTYLLGCQISSRMPIAEPIPPYT